MHSERLHHLPTQPAPGVSALESSLLRRSASGRARAWKRFRRHRVALVSLFAIAAVALLGLFAPWIVQYGPTETSLSRSLQPPSMEHWLGTDEVGRDIFSRTLYGARVSLSVGIVAVGITVAISLILGTMSGYYGGVVDAFIMRATDVIMCIPGLVIILAMVSILGPGIFNIMVAIGVLGWTGMTRLLRGQVLSTREREYVVAARAIGASNLRVMAIHVLPNCVAPLLVAATLGIAGAILTEAALSFLGFGVVPPTPSWGGMLNTARTLTRLQDNPWMWLPPGTMIMISVLAINFIGDGLQHALDPRQTERTSS